MKSRILSPERSLSKVMSVVPFGLRFFLRSGSGFLDPLMTTTFGHIIMTVALIMIIFGLIISQRIMRIEV